MAIIALEGMRFRANHGCFEEERKIGTDFVVDLKLKVDASEAQENDDIATTVNYQEVYNCVADEMKVPSHLLEHVAARMVKSLMGRFESVEWVSVKVSKLNPPLGGQLYAASVTLFERR